MLRTRWPANYRKARGTALAALLWQQRPRYRWSTAACLWGVVIHDQVDLLAGRCGCFNQGQKLNPLLMAVSLVKRIHDLSAVDIHRRQQSGGSMALVIVGLGRAMGRLRDDLRFRCGWMRRAVPITGNLHGELLPVHNYPGIPTVEQGAVAVRGFPEAEAAVLDRAGEAAYARTPIRPWRKSSTACCNSSRLFMTNGP